MSLNICSQKATVMAKWLAGQTGVLKARVQAPHDSRFSVQCNVIALPAIYDAITGPTKFIYALGSVYYSLKINLLNLQLEITDKF